MRNGDFNQIKFKKVITNSDKGNHKCLKIVSHNTKNIYVSLELFRTVLYA